MRANPEELSAAVAWGDVGVANARALAGRCDRTCRRHHWGYVISGVVRVSYPDHDEVLSAGDAYYVAPTHVSIDVGDAQLVDFTRAAATPGSPA